MQEKQERQERNPLDEYTLLSVIGKGSYAKVVLVRKKTNGNLYALKSMKKKYIEKKNQCQRIMTQKKILTEINHPFLIKIHASFQNEVKLYLVLQYCPGGQLFGLLSKRKRLNQTNARFYVAQIVLALQYLHSKNIVYRDLKPENVLIGKDGYIKLTDFGLSRSNILNDYQAFSVCGTPEYLAPQVIKKEGHGRAVDWWCLGCILYELVHGLPPFYAKNRGQLYDLIKSTEPEYNKNWSKHLRDLLSKLLLKNPDQRIKFIPNIKQHPWFAMLKWNQVLTKTNQAPFVPILNHESDVSHFAPQFTKCELNSHQESYEGQECYQGFSFQRSISPQLKALSPQLQPISPTTQPLQSNETQQSQFTLLSKQV